MMTDEELNILMQSLSDEEIGGLYASLPEENDEAAAGRIADRFYKKCAAAGVAVGHSRPVQQTVKQRPRIPLKYMGFAAAACVAVAAGAVAFYNAQTEKPGVILEPASSGTAAVTEITVSQTTTATVTTGENGKTQTTETSVSTGEVDTTSAADTETTPAETVTETIENTSANTEQIQTTGTEATRTASNTTVSAARTTTTTTLTTTTKLYTSTTTTTRWIPHTETSEEIETDPMFHTTVIITSAVATYASGPPTTAEVERPNTSVYYSTTATGMVPKTTAAIPPTETTTNYQYSETQPYFGETDHAAAWLVHAPYTNTYQRGEWYDLSGTVLGVWYSSDGVGTLESIDDATLEDYPELFTIDDSEYDCNRSGTYPIRIIYDRGEALGSPHPASPAIVSIYVTVL